MARWPGFCGGSSPGASVIQNCERTINFYTELAQGRGSKSDQALLSTPGYTAWSSGVTDVGTRGTFVANGRPFAVIGGHLWEFSSTGGATVRGSVLQDANPAQFIYNGVVQNQMGICAGGAVYVYDLGTNTLTLTTLTSGYTHLAFLDAYGLAFNPTTGLVQLSAVGDLSTYSGANFLARSKFPDPWRAMWVDQNGLIWLIGTDSFEAWYNTGRGNQPFTPLAGVQGLWGIAAPFAYASTGRGNVWLSQGQQHGVQVIASTGGAPQPVSTYAVNTALSGFRRAFTIANAEVMSYGDEGHTFVNFSFPSVTGTDHDTPTFTLDMETGSWANRGEWNTATSRYDVWAARCHMDVFNTHLVGDRTTGTIWALDATVSTDRSGQGIRRLRQAPSLTDEHKRVPIDQLEVIMDVGLGTQSGQGVDPQMLLQMSGDGGVTFGNQRQAGIGRIGQYRRRVVWNRLGAPADAVPRIVVSDPVPVRIVDGYWNNASGQVA